MHGQKILHVEDDSDDAFIVQRAFNKAASGYVIDQVTDGEKAISYLSSIGQNDALACPAAILLDLKLPGKDGFDVLQWARAQDRYKSLPIIILTSSDRPEDMVRAKALGATAYLNKSTSCSNVLELLGKLLAT